LQQEEGHAALAARNDRPSVDSLRRRPPAMWSATPRPKMRGGIEIADYESEGFA
jgi:hypothetical protein